MKKTTKLISFFVALMLLVLSLGACNNAPAETTGETDPLSPNTTAVTVNIAGMTGPTGIGLVGLKSESEKGQTEGKYNVSFYASAQEIVPLLVKGELDIAAVPANLAAIQFNNNNGYVQVLAINTLGVLSILEKGDTIKSVSDLKGKVIYVPASGKGSTPEYALNFILTSNGLDPAKDVTIEWKSEVTEILAALKKTDGGIAMLPQPAATNALNNVDGLREAINLNDAWNALGVDSKQVTGVIVVRTAFAETNPEAVSTFLREYEASTKFANENVAEASKLVGEYNIAAEAVALKAIPKCNITFIKGAEMKTILSAYLKTLFDANNASVGGKMPSDSFYYAEK